MVKEDDTRCSRQFFNDSLTLGIIFLQHLLVITEIPEVGRPTSILETSIVEIIYEFPPTDILYWDIKIHPDSISVTISCSRVCVCRLKSALSIKRRELISQRSSYDIRSSHGTKVYDSIGPFYSVQIVASLVIGSSSADEDYGARIDNFAITNFVTHTHTEHFSSARSCSRAHD